MPDTIKSLTQMMRYISMAEPAFIEEMQGAVARSALHVQVTAKEKFGTYQEATPPFEPWPALAPYTVARKEQAGAEDDDPLIGHYLGDEGHGRPGGGLRASILVEVKGLVGQVGTNDKLAPIHEYGTKRIPPRPYLRPALIESEEFIKREFQKAIAKGLTMR